MRVVCNFSCGAASAVATKIALDKYRQCEIVYCDTGSEHPDNNRFKDDCEKWFGQKITIVKSEKYSNIYEVFEERRFLSSFQGAPCTGEMKRIPARTFIEIGDLEVYGYTVEESHRVERWKKDNFDRLIECPLIDRGLTKDDCFAIIDRVGIELPAMYRLGFRNNNCIGCVKARDSIDYWKRVRKHFPDQFAKTAKLERELNVCLNRVTVKGERKFVFLDEIEEGDPVGRDPNIQCGLFCMSEADQFS